MSNENKCGHENEDEDERDHDHDHEPEHERECTKVEYDIGKKRYLESDQYQQDLADKAELEEQRERQELELREEKSNTQKRMAWTAMASMIIFTIVLFSPIVTNDRVTALADLLGLFYIAQAGVVGAYMGFQSWMSK